MGWLDTLDITNDPAPAANAGYSGLNIPPEVAPDLKRGIVWHSTSGFFDPPGYVPSDLMRSRNNSWDATIMSNGRIWRHRPRPTFVNWHGGGPAQNVPLLGIEVEGTNQPWTEAQRASALRVARETYAYFGWEKVWWGFLTPKTQEAIRRAITQTPKGSHWEHNWLSATSCPNGRNDWNWFLPAVMAVVEGEQPMNEADKAWVRSEIGRYLGSGDQGSLARILDVIQTSPESYPRLNGELRAVILQTVPTSGTDISAVIDAIIARLQN